MGFIRLCIKVGRGQGDRDACVRTWDLATRDEGLEDARREGREIQDAGTRLIYCKSRRY